MYCNVSVTVIVTGEVPATADATDTVRCLVPRESRFAWPVFSEIVSVAGAVVELSDAVTQDAPGDAERPVSCPPPVLVRLIATLPAATCDWVRTNADGAEFDTAMAGGGTTSVTLMFTGL